MKEVDLVENNKNTFMSFPREYKILNLQSMTPAESNEQSYSVAEHRQLLMRGPNTYENSKNLNAPLGGADSKFGRCFGSGPKRNRQIANFRRIGAKFESSYLHILDFRGAAVSCRVCNLEKQPHEPIRVIDPNSSLNA